MNARVAFDTHAFDAMGDIVLHSIATKTDLKEAELSLRSELKDLRTELKELELRLTLRTGGMITAAVAILAALKILS